MSAFKQPKHRSLGPRRKGNKSSAASPFKPPRLAGEAELEDCQQTQTMEEPACEGKALEISSASSTEEHLTANSSSEEDFRWHAHEMITKHGLEMTKALFNLEAMKAKKPKKK